MPVTLLLIYSIGFGNQAILSEKFRNMDECNLYVKITQVRLGNKFISADCL